MVFSKSNKSKIKYREYITNLYEYKSTGTSWIALYMNSDNETSFDSFRVNQLSKEIKRIIRNKNITKNTYRIQSYNSVISEFFCIEFIDFMMKRKSL